MAGTRSLQVEGDGVKLPNKITKEEQAKKTLCYWRGYSRHKLAARRRREHPKERKTHRNCGIHAARREGQQWAGKEREAA